MTWDDQGKDGRNNFSIFGRISSAKVIVMDDEEELSSLTRLENRVYYDTNVYITNAH
jgi:hypothetical protein